MAEIVYMATVLALLGLFAWREYRHDAERRDLYTRLMARDLAEYHQAQAGNPPGPRPRNFIQHNLEQFRKEMGAKRREEAS